MAYARADVDLFTGDDDDLQGLIRDHMILPYLFGDFHPSHIQEYAGGLFLTLEKPAKDCLGPRGRRQSIICGEIWHSCFASLATNSVQGPISRIFTSAYNFFLQTAGLQDVDSRCAKILSAMYVDPSYPDVIIKLDIS